MLTHFDADFERAGAEYEQMRAQLILFFHGRGCARAEDLADEAVNRVARRIAKGETIQPKALLGYFYGVARNVSREYLRDPHSVVMGLSQLPPFRHPVEGHHKEPK